jgi:hypothetical protein
MDQTSYGEAHLKQVNLSDIRVIMAIMRILMRESLCQVVTGQILVLEYPLFGTCECLWLRPVIPGIK